MRTRCTKEREGHARIEFRPSKAPFRLRAWAIEPRGKALGEARHRRSFSNRTTTSRCFNAAGRKETRLSSFECAIRQRGHYQPEKLGDEREEKKRVELKTKAVKDPCIFLTFFLFFGAGKRIFRSERCSLENQRNIKRKFWKRYCVRNVIWFLTTEIITTLDFNFYFRRSSVQTCQYAS